MIKHQESVSGLPGHVEDATLERGLPSIPVQEDLGLLPTRDEVRYCLLAMKESTAGKDEVTVSMIKYAGEHIMEE
eukprot:4131879-Pyramimonas_sp.AAC.1